MEQLVLRAPALERLECAIGTFSDELFVQLPATVKYLSLELLEGDVFPSEAGLAHLLARLGAWGISLTEIEALFKGRCDEELAAHGARFYVGSRTRCHAQKGSLEMVLTGEWISRGM